jgi:hypothetical protein
MAEAFKLDLSKEQLVQEPSSKERALSSLSFNLAPLSQLVT